MQTEKTTKTIAIVTYPGDEYMGLNTKLEEIDIFFYVFGRGPYKAQAKNSRDSVIIIQSEYYKGLPPYRVSILINEALESRINPGDTIIVPSCFEADRYRREISAGIQKLLTRKNYSFNVIDYSIEGIQPKATRIKINEEHVLNMAQEKYGSTITIKTRPHEEFFERHTVEKNGRQKKVANEN